MTENTAITSEMSPLVIINLGGIMILQEEDIGVDPILPEKTVDTGIRIEAETFIIIGGLHLVIGSHKSRRAVAG